MKAYIDTCIISGIAKGDINQDEFDALLNLLEMHKSKMLEAVTSQVAKEELDKIPEKYRNQHIMVYNLLSNIPVAEYLQLDFFSFRGLPVKQTKEFSELFSLLKDEEDAKHIYQASRNGVNYFITVDRRSILNKKNSIEKICDLEVLSPLEFMRAHEKYKA